MKLRPTGVIPPMTTMPEASPAQQAAIASALEGLGASSGKHIEAAE